MNNSERWHHQPALYMGAFSAMAERGEHIVVPAVPAARDPESEALATAVRSHADEETRELAGASRAASSILHEELARMASVWAAQGEQHEKPLIAKRRPGLPLARDGRVEARAYRG